MTEISTVIATGRAIMTTVTEMNNLPLKSQVLQLVDQLGQARLTEIERIEEIFALKAKVRELQSQLDLRADMVYEDNVFWMQPQTGGAKEGPCCPKCWQASSIVSRMQEEVDDACWRCKVCDAYVARPDAESIRLRSHTAARTAYDPME